MQTILEVSEVRIELRMMAKIDWFTREMHRNIYSFEAQMGD